jgi:hypothetical protein
MDTGSLPQNGPPKLQITILEKKYEVVEDNLIWIFQELGMIRFSNKFCWNGECKNCVITFKIGAGVEATTERACRTPAQDGMMITDLPAQFYNKGKV